MARDLSLVRALELPFRRPPDPVVDPSVLAGYLEDASGDVAGTASGLLRVSDEAEAAAFLRATAGRGVPVLPQAARSSLTGGAIPRGEVVVSVERLTDFGPIERYERGARVTVAAGVRLHDLQRVAGEHGYYYPPVPTYDGAMIGGTASTNAGGAASFKYGVTRRWIQGLRVLLFNGDLLAIERGQVLARRGEGFRIVLSDGCELRVPVPDYRLPDLKKVSAGYYAADPLDMVDLFVGSEGTLGLITAVTLDLAPLPAGVVSGLTFVRDIGCGLSLAGALREAAVEARARTDPAGPDVRAIELMDMRCLDLLRQHAGSRRLRVRIPAEAGAALLFAMETDDRMSNLEVEALLGALLEGGGGIPDGPLARLFAILRNHDALEGLEFAFPEDTRRQATLVEFREAVPQRVNEIIAERRRLDSAVRKVGGDLIVPFERLPEMVRVYEEGFKGRGLSFAIWGHVSDGNLHPNALPRNAEEVERAEEALMEFAREAAVRGGCPLSEHGVGRSALKKRMLRAFLGDAALESMLAVKRALDPEGRFAPGVLLSTPFNAGETPNSIL